MKPDYKNWMPKGMVLSAVIVTAVFLLLFIIFGFTGLISGVLKTVLFIVFLVGTVIGLCASLWMILMYRAFSYNGKRQMSRQIIEGVAEYIKLPDGHLSVSTAGARNMPRSTNRSVKTTQKRRESLMSPFHKAMPANLILQTRPLTR